MENFIRESPIDVDRTEGAEWRRLGVIDLRTLPVPKCRAIDHRWLPKAGRTDCNGKWLELRRVVTIMSPTLFEKAKEKAGLA
jgi:hypothetical protein